jgi:two-component system chemotaxis sensor kinase CheA
LKSISSFAGATIMGDGRVALILDVLGMAQRANVVSETRDRTVVEKAEAGDCRSTRQKARIVFSLPTRTDVANKSLAINLCRPSGCIYLLPMI